MNNAPVKNTNIPACFDYRFFYGTGSVILNDPMADALASALLRSEEKDRVLDAIAKDLVGAGSEVEFDDSNDEVPSYNYTYFRNCGTLLLNKSASTLVAKAIFASGGGKTVPPYLWSLACQLNVDRFKQKDEDEDA
ncbi:MAG: hypothetical protein DWQ19_09140 [Crenarchaeota archaeon]|nr:MAG: hypothetical protein DWQ19_09140 [Thermoproteota archaeon]